MDKELPLVSICCITYNHVRYIRASLDGMLRQITTFPIEILIHDDCSSDGTTEIIKEYEAKFPKLIFPIYESVNQYQNGHESDIDLFNYRRAKGKYIAYCEGDDFWIDKYKLQKQIDFLENHSDYSVCFHGTRILEADTGFLRPMGPYPGDADQDIDVTPKMILYSNMTNVGQPLSMVFRRDCYDLSWPYKYTFYCDTIEIFNLLKVGKGRLMKFDGGRYVVHGGGVSASSLEKHQSEKSMISCIELYRYHHDAEVRQRLIDTFFWSLSLHNSCKSRIDFHLYLASHEPSVWLSIVFIAWKRFIKRVFFS